MNNLITVGTDLGTYTVNNGTKTITLNGMGYTVKVEELAYIINLTQLQIYHAATPELAKCSIASNVITFDAGEADIVTGDKVHIQLFKKGTGVDEASNAIRSFITNLRSTSSPIILVSEEDQGVNVTNRYVLPGGDNIHYGVYVKLFADTTDDEVVFTFHATNDVDADDTADTGWPDNSSDLMGAANLTANNNTQEEFYFIDTAFVALKYMFKLEYGLSSSGITENNSADIIIVQF